MARPCKLTPDVQAAICKTLQAGVDPETAALREGISRSTYYSWLKQGREGAEPYAGFVEAVERALADVETAVTLQIIKASRNNWQAAAWWVKWQRTKGTQRIELTGKDGAPLTGHLTPETADIIRQRILYGDSPPPSVRKRLASYAERDRERADELEPVMADEDTEP